MGNEKRGSAADSVYASHFGLDGHFKPNTAVQREASIERVLQKQLVNLAANRFKWDGFPETVDTRFLEMTLLYQALAVVYYDHDYDVLLAVRGAGTGFVNAIDNPISFNVVGPIPRQNDANVTDPNVVTPYTTLSTDIGTGLYTRQIRAFDRIVHLNRGFSNEDRKKLAVPIWANFIRVPDLDLIRIYASRLAWLDRTLEINAKNARRNKVLKAPQNMSLSVQNFAKQADQGTEYIQVAGAMQDMEFIEALDLGVNPDSYDKLSILRTRVWNECMTLLGIDSANQDKKERLVAAEVSANDSQTDSFRFVALNARRQACEAISECFGVKVTVDYNVEVEAQAQAQEAAQLAQMPDAGEGGADYNDNVHNES